jgi:hypothetical protein
MQYVIDRIENGWATLEDESATAFNVPANWLPPEAREGDVLRMTVEALPGSCTVRFTLDPAAREDQQKKARDLRDKLPRGPKGDMTL